MASLDKRKVLKFINKLPSQELKKGKKSNHREFKIKFPGLKLKYISIPFGSKKQFGDPSIKLMASGLDISPHFFKELVNGLKSPNDYEREIRKKENEL